MKTTKLTVLAATLGFLSLSHNAMAAETQTVSFTQISSEAAFNLAHEAVNQCEADGYKVSATVVDLSGNVIAQLRSDGAGNVSYTHLRPHETYLEISYAVICLKKKRGGGGGGGGG
ncbi:heme-binding protein, partial [Vibrio splendidus]